MGSPILLSKLRNEVISVAVNPPLKHIYDIYSYHGFRYNGIDFASAGKQTSFYLKIEPGLNCHLLSAVDLIF